MARFIPDELPSTATVAEKGLFAKLRELPDAYLILCLQGRYPGYPNFIVIENTLGLVLVNVSETSPASFSAQFLKQLSRLRKEPILLDASGKINLPNGILQVLSGYAEPADVPTTLKKGMVVTRSELATLVHEAEPIENLITLLRKTRTQPPGFIALSEAQKDMIRAAFDLSIWFKDIYLSDVQQDVFRKINNTRGHQIIAGVAGSGKTLILAALAQDIIRENPQAKVLCLCFNQGPTQFLKALLKDNPYFVEGATPTLEVLTFNTWAHRLGEQLPALRFDEPIRRFTNVADQLQQRGDAGQSSLDKIRAVIKTLEAVLDRDPTVLQLGDDNGWRLLKFLIDDAGLAAADRYDAIVIDEAHLFEPHWFIGAVLALKAGVNGTLAIARDTAQSLDAKPLGLFKTLGVTTWKQMGIRAQGRTRYLTINYRNTLEILEAAWSVIKGQVGEIPRDEDDLGGVVIPTRAPESVRMDRLAQLKVVPLSRLKGAPRTAAQSLAHQIEPVLATVQQLRNDGIASQNIAVLYREQQADLLQGLCQHLEASGAGYYWVNRDREALLNYKPALPGVKLLTTRTALGMEFDAVIVMWLDQFDRDFEEPVTTATLLGRRQLYVAMTRPRRHLVLVGSDTSQAVQYLRQTNCFAVEEYRPHA